MAQYTHGTYGVIEDAVVANVDEATTAIVAVGTLPVHLAPDWPGLVGKPLAVEDATAKSAYGYSPDWASYSLCEVVQAFVGGASGNIGGLRVINALDPATHRAASDTEATVTFADGKGALTDPLGILSTFAIEGQDDVTATYDWGTGVTTIEAGALSGAKTVTYRRVNPSAVTAAQVVAAIEAIDDIYPLENAVPGILLAPGWSEDPTVYAALTAKARAVDGRFYAFAVADMPATSAVGTIEQAIAWKAANGYTSKHSKACWPRAKDSAGTVYHLSTLYAREMAREDAARGGVPYATASNTAIESAGVCLADGAAVKMYQEQGNQLNAYGISTAIAWRGEVQLWGGHTAGYIYGADKQEASAIFDTNIRMLAYIVNSFQTRWAHVIDEPMTLALQETILFTERTILDGLLAQGALVGKPTITFSPASNPASDIVQGEFTWDVSATPTPPLKAARAVVAYTTDGLSAYIAEEGE